MTLTVRDIHTYYGRSHVLQGISLEVADGEIVALLGRNGAGKTTTMRSIVGLTPAREGQIMLDDVDLARMPTHRIARRGLAFVPSGRRTYGSLTVRQNLALAAERQRRGSAWTMERVLEMFPRLIDLSGRRAEYLSGGEQQMLKLARALLSGPRMLLLDEPTEGLSPAVVADLGRWLATLREDRVTVLITEQNALFALRYAHRGYIIEKGTVRHQAAADDLRDSREIQAYLGVGADT